METIRLEYLGKFKDGAPKIVLLPVPFISAADKTGEVVCDPIGTFPREDGIRLLEICPGAFRVVGEADPTVRDEDDLTDQDALDERLLNEQLERLAPALAIPAPELPTDQPIEAHRSLQTARMRAGRRKLVIVENRTNPADPEKPFELWAPSPEHPAGAATARPTSHKVKGKKVANG